MKIFVFFKYLYTFSFFETKKKVTYPYLLLVCILHSVVLVSYLSTLENRLLFWPVCMTSFSQRFLRSTCAAFGLSWSPVRHPRYPTVMVLRTLYHIHQVRSLSFFIFPRLIPRKMRDIALCITLNWLAYLFDIRKLYINK